MAPTIVKDEVQDRLTNRKLPVVTFMGTRLPPLAAMPALPFQLPNVRTSLLERGGQGLNVIQAFAQAQGVTDRSLDSVVTAQGELDALRYGGVLKPRGMVGLRGAGFTYDGMYYVKSVATRSARASTSSASRSRREGTGSITPVVVP